MFSELSLLREDTVWRTPNLVISEDLKPRKIQTFCQKMCSRFSRLRLQSVCKNVHIVGSLMKHVFFSDIVRPVVSAINGNVTYFMRAKI